MGESFSQLYCKECDGRLWYYENLRELYSETSESFELKRKNRVNHPENLKGSEPENHLESGNYESFESESEIQDDSESYESFESEITEINDYSEPLEHSELVKIGKGTYTEWKVTKYTYIIFIGATLLFVSAWAFFYGYIWAIIPILLFFVLVIYFLSSSKSWKKGDKGEKIVARHLDDLPGCIIFNDVNLPHGWGNIDHVILSPKGLFVLETKNYNGHFTVKGDEWFYKLGHRFKISKSNPGKQIKRNALSLKKFLEQSMDMDKVWINSLVVMVNGHVDIKGSTPHYYITRPSQIERTIKTSKSMLDLDNIYSMSCLLQDHCGEMVYRASDWPEDWTQ